MLPCPSAEHGTSLGKDGHVADDILELQRAFDDAELHGDAGRLAAIQFSTLGSS
jgi:hypothetical protein